MDAFIGQLQQRNTPLYYFGLLCLLAALACLVLIKFTHTQVGGVNAWYKPFKFFVSVGLFAWTMGWYLHYLGPLPTVSVYSWGVIILLGLEVVYIAVQAGRGQLSHFKVDTPVYALLYGFMGLAAVAVAVGTAYIGILFYLRDFPELPSAYVWGIRIGIGLFVLFALQGLVMGSSMRHTIGGPDGDSGLPVVNWSRKYGDLRAAHFMGMHALQILPALSFYLVKNTKVTLMVGFFVALSSRHCSCRLCRRNPFFDDSGA